MKTRIRAFSGLFTILIMMMLFASCNQNAPQDPKDSVSTSPEHSLASGQPSDNTADGDTGKEPENVATLVVDVSFGSGNESLMSRYEYGYDGPLTVETLAKGLSDLTGLNFAINDSSMGKGGVSVDWSTDATFIAGLGELAQKEEFFVYDNESLTWLMLDSMYRTIQENIGGDIDVFYSMDGWNTLTNEVLAPDGGFPKDLPYTGNHAGRGDDLDADAGGSLEGDGDNGVDYWNDIDFGANLGYTEEYKLESDPGGSMNAAEAAKFTFDAMRDSKHVPEYSDSTQYQMVLADLQNINGEECYVYRLEVDEPTGTIGAAYAYAYQTGNIYMQGYGGQWVKPAR